MTENKGFRSIGRRTLSPGEQTIRRQQLLERTTRAVLDAAYPLQPGVYTSVELTPHKQQHSDSCGIACALAIRSGIARARGLLLPIIREDELLREAAARGVYQPGGICPEREETAIFLRERVGIQAELLPYEAPTLARACVDQIREGNLCLLAQPGHFTVLFGMDKLSEYDLRWLMMNPLLNHILRITTPDLSERIVGTVLQPGSNGVSGSVLAVNVGESNLLLNQQPRFTSIRKFVPH